MAKVVVGAEVQVKTNGAEGSVKSLKQQLKEAQADVATLSEKFGATSQAAVDAAKKAAGLKDAIGDAKALTDAFSPDKKFQAFSSALQGVVGGFTALQGAQALFGAKSEELEKTLLKVQGAMALSQGLNSLLEAKDAFKNLQAVAVNAFKAIRGAISSTGIGLLIVALGTLVAYWDDIKEAISGVSEEQKKLVEDSNKNYQVEKEKSKILDQQENTLKLQGKTEKEILQLKIAQTNQEIDKGEIALKNSIALTKSQYEASARNKEILVGILDWLNAPLNYILSGVDLIGKAVGKNFGLADKLNETMAKWVFDPEQVKKEGEASVKEQESALKDLVSKRDGYRLQLQEIDKKSNQDRKKSNEEKLQLEREAEDAIRKAKEDAFLAGIRDDQERAKEQLRINAENAKIEIERTKYTAEQKAELLKQNAIKYWADLAQIDADAKAKEKEALDKANEELFQTMMKEFNQELELAEAKKKLDEEAFKNKEAQLSKISGLLNNFSEIAGKNTAAGKALSVASAVIDTYSAANQVLAAKSPAFIINPYLRFASAAATIVTGLMNVKKILSVKVPGGGGGSAPSGVSPVSAPITPQIGGTQLNQNQVNQLSSATNRAFVLESDVSGNQERIRRLNRAARIN